MKPRIKTYRLPATVNFRLYVVTDTHYELKRPQAILGIIKQAQKSRPDAILIAGDFLNYLDDLSTSISRQFLSTFFDKLSKIAPVYLGIGNHDQMYKNRSYIPQKAKKEQQVLLDFLAKIPSVTLLHNKKVKLSNNLYLIGITLPRSCYQKPGANATKEDPKDLQKILNQNAPLLKKQSPNDTNILVLHSPRRLTPEIEATLPGVDYIITGHMHQGCVPLGLDEILPGTRGLIAPGYAPFPIRARRTYPNYSQKLLVLPAYTTFTGRRYFLNRLYHQSHTLLHLEK